MTSNRGQATGVGGGFETTSDPPLPASTHNSFSAVLGTEVSCNETMTRITQSSVDSPIRTSNGLTDKKTSLVGLLNNSASLFSNSAATTHYRHTTGMAAESGMLKRKLSDLGDDINSKRNRILDYKAVRLKRIRKDYVDHICEKLTIEGCAYADIYRKRPSIPSLLHYFNKNPLDPNDKGEDLISLVEDTVSGQQDLKGLKVTSVSTSLTLSSSSVGLPNSQATVSDTDLTAPSSSSQTSSSSRTSTPNTSQRAQCSHENSMTNQEQIVERAKQEAQVVQRIGELQREGLWAEKRLPKVQEPTRVKAHWDYLLEEMVWLAADFAQERKWKKAAAKKCAKMVHKYFQDKEIMAQKAVKSQEMQLKRIASCMAKEIKQFWTNVEKLVEYKQQARLEEKRKKALDQHLSFIMDQTEKYSSLVAESMNKPGLESVSHSVVSSRAPSPSNLLRTSDVEFEPGGTSSDDEETIAKAEAEDEKEEGVDKSKEIELLQRESELPLEDLLKDYLDNRENIVLEGDEENASSEEDKDEEFRVSDKDSSDDEETIQEQEKAEGKVDHKQELDDLKVESEMSLEDLKLKYGAMQTNGSEPIDTESQGSESEEIKESESSSEEDAMDVDGIDATEDLSTLLAEDTTSSEQATEKEARDAEINDVAAIAESIQPKGNTLSSTSVVTKIPFLLKHTLREYQHIGLDWLVTMHDRKLNGILADEMGLGKTIQTISVLAHLACEKGVWGPHLIVVPTSVMLNWEMEFKKWCPAFKILTYYGTMKERKTKRTGWTKPNAFHVCITSYKLVIQDHQSFRRKSWKYLILDEAQNIKNFKSQRWQLLLNFQTQRRLLLTGTPLQNNLMELWSLMHFLMPNLFQSHREFKEWFSNPVTGMIEGNSEYNEQIIKRLHKVLRPFLLRRLKCEVEKQLPKKYEHVVMCRLSNRQRYLYEDFMSRAKTKETLATGNLLSVINVLMQLRKVCNHPNLFELRPTVSPFQMEAIECFTASCVWSALDYDPFKHVSLPFLDFGKVDLEFWMSAFMAHRARQFCTPSNLIEEIDSEPPPPPKCPRGRIRVHIKYSAQSDSKAQVKPIVALDGAANKDVTNTSVPPKMGLATVVRPPAPQALAIRIAPQVGQLQSYAVQLVPHKQSSPIKVALSAASSEPGTSGGIQRISVPTGFAQLVQTNTGKHLLFTTSPHLTTPGTSSAVVTTGGQRLLIGSGVAMTGALTRFTAAPASAVTVTTPLAVNQSGVTVGGGILVAPTAVGSNSTVTTGPSPSKSTRTTPTKRQLQADSFSNVFKISRLEEKRKKWRQDKLAHTAMVNEQRCTIGPMYGWDLVRALRLVDLPDVAPCNVAHDTHPSLFWYQTIALSQAILSVEQILQKLRDLIDRFVVYVPAVNAPRARFHVSHPPPWKLWQEQRREVVLEAEFSPRAICLHPIVEAMMTQFPDPSLIQYDCGKLQSLDRLLRQLKADHHRVLIFTQMTRMLDVLEAFLNFHGHIYLRLDGTTRVEQRQVLMERFNGDKRIFCFILSTRSGGVGVNLTGADTVIFYDSDWNPTMDAQAQDRCHRIGQTRDVHIYRLVSEKTVEENILKKANQKRMLGDLAIEGGNFTTAYFKSGTIQDLFTVDVSENDVSTRMAEVFDRDYERRSQFNNEDMQYLGSNVEEKAALGVLESALAAAEDEPDVAAAKTAKAEAVADLAEFDESIPLDQDGEPIEEVSRAEQEVNALIQQLSGVERYAMKFIEETEAAWSAEQLAAAEAEIEQQKREWEEERLAALRLQEEVNERDKADAAEELITYSGEDARNQVNNTTQPRTRSRATVQIDLWTLDVSPIPSTTVGKPLSPQVDLKKEKKINQASFLPISNSTASNAAVSTPYSNPNLVIRTRRAATNPILSKGTWEINNHVSDPYLVGRKVARLNKAKSTSRSSSIEGNGPVL